MRTRLTGVQLLEQGSDDDALAAHGAQQALGLRLQPRASERPLRRDTVFRRLLALADTCAALGGLATVAVLNGHRLPLASLVTVPALVLVAKMMGRYDHDEVVLRKSTLDEMPALLGLSAAYAVVWSLFAFVANLSLRLGGGGVIIPCATTFVLLVALRAGARAVGQASAPRERVLIVGSAAARARVAQSLATDPAARIEVAGFLPLEDERRVDSDWGTRSRRIRPLRFEDLARVVRDRDVDRVFLIPTSADQETMLDAVSRTTAIGVKVSIVPRLLEVVGSAVEFDTVGGVTVLGVRRPGLTRSSRAVKRAMDLIGAATGLVLLVPAALLVALAIKLDSPGPVLFFQRRVGRDGCPFTVIKFRSMVNGAETRRQALEQFNDSEGNFKMAADPRITRVGRVLRRSSLDELPQLINVLRGDMSLVGPRPLVLREDRLVRGRHRERLQLAPGMTGPWQVLGPRRPPLSEMVKIDYLYATSWSLWTDLKILLRTAGHIWTRRGV